MSENTVENESLVAELRDVISEHMQTCRGWSVSSLASFLADACARAGQKMRMQHRYEDIVKIEKKQAEIVAMLEALPEPTSDAREALFMASCYIRYVKEKNPELHAEADGTPSIEQAVEAAFAEAHGRAA